MGYLHVEIDIAQTAKKDSGICGDAVRSFRTPEATVVLLVDGIGSGIKANIYANMACSRLEKLLESGFSLRKAFSSLVKTMHESRGSDMPYSVFTIVRILNNGEATILSYEMPEAIFVGRHSASVLQRRNFTLEREVISESNLFLESGEGLVLFSDGITLAGIGGKTRQGWNPVEICRFVNDKLAAGERKKIHQKIHRHAIDLWGHPCGDDCTVLSVFCRPGKVANILTGPPSSPVDDQKIISCFLALPGLKIVCGATTAQIVARHLGVEMTINAEDTSMISPPGYSIKGIDLVTEGAVTLNQLYNILDADPNFLDPDSAVTRLFDAIIDADRINFMVGMTLNIGHTDIAFRQQGIIPRIKIVELLAEKLTSEGRLIDIKKV
ncbi:MAG: SpoIIE family protein phosphatase [Candidatus Riflebacteria bacterium]|jgi:hypothetical protein|nr:SpoIIE family protein phosphatase [Candidatus Riflebacteria bacterium]